ncbi:oxygenase MpaB family protein [Agromyces sp. LHK192]|uniref:oxygenase MpaB family protein n=1 Tax=Agromyces sp. LHK192 TaxID=2498704 RepID=UPI000FDA4057|nr:oxygenase MpaB family protein [Agromyces sp. LHK192]
MRIGRSHRRLHDLERLDPATDYEHIGRVVGTLEFPWDLQQALSFALFRTYAVPTIGGLLYDTGEFEHRAQKRHDDTVLILDAVAVDGLESDDGRAAVRAMNRMHGHYDISNDDMRYVLSTFVVTPIRWIAAYGWRRQSRVEVDAAVHYYVRLGRLMGIRDLPETYEAFADLMDAYEREHFRPDRRTRVVADSTLDLLTTFYPRPMRRVIRGFSIAILDPHLREALGYPAPSRLARGASVGALKLRGRVVSLLPARRRPQYARDLKRIRSYPGGYLVEQLGTFA